MIQKDEIRQVLESAKALGIEFAELFFEDREETNIPCIETVIQGVKSLRICGAHMRSRSLSYTRAFKCLSLYKSGNKGSTS